MFKPKIGLLTIIFMLLMVPGIVASAETTYSDADGTIEALRNVIADLDNDGAFSNPGAARALTVHLTAVGVFERQQNGHKVVQHMEGFHQLIDHQLEKEWISQETHLIIQTHAEAITRQWDSLVIVNNGEARAVIVAPTIPLDILNAGPLPGWNHLSTYMRQNVKVVDTKSFSGQNSLHILDENEQAYGVESELIEIESGQNYTASAMAYHEDGNKPLIYIRFYDENKERLDQSLVGDGVQGEWSEISVTGYAPEKAVYASIVLYCSTLDQGSMYFDDVKLVNEQGEKLPLKNPEFEQNVNDLADILIEYVEKATGAVLPVTTEAGLSDEGYDGFARIYLEIHHGNDDEFIQNQFQQLDSQGFIIYPHEDRITIKGPTEWGTLNGVYDFIERFLDVRWLMPGQAGEDVPLLNDVVVPREAIIEEPAFAFRALSPFLASPEAGGSRQQQNEWAQRNKLQGSYNWTASFHHNVHSLYPVEKYGETNPEFYPGGMPPTPGNVTAWQPCFTAEGSVDVAVSGIIEFFNSNPDAASFSLGINDSRNFCEADPAHPHHPGKTNSVGDLDMSDLYYTWVNEVVEQVLEVFPDKWFGLLAYNNVMDPPSFELNPRVVPFVTKDRMTWIDDEIRTENQQQMDVWNEVASQVAWYDYMYGTFYALPRVYPHIMAENYQYAEQVGVFGHYAEMYQNVGDGPKAWISAKLQWDPYQDVDALLKEWYERMVGSAAADDLAAYYDLWEQFWTERITDHSWFHNGKGRTYLPFTSASYLDLVTEEDIAESRRLMELVVAKAETPEQQQRANILMSAFEYYEATALSYAQSNVIAPPASEQEAMKLLDRIEQSLEMAEKRHELIAEFNSEPALQFPIQPRFDWNGVQRHMFNALQKYVENEQEGGPVGQLVDQFLADLSEHLRGQFLGELPDEFIAYAVKTTAGKTDVLQSLDFSEGPWAAAEPFSDYLVMNSATDLPLVDTNTYLLWDDEYLYVGYENFDPNMSDMIVSDDASGGWWSDGGNDSVETYVAKDSSGSFKGFFTNPKAVKFVYEKDPSSGPRPISNVEWDATAWIGEDRWNVIQAIPFAEIDVNPQETDMLEGFFFRDYHGHFQYIGWGGGAPWQAEDFNPIYLIEK